MCVQSVYYTGLIVCTGLGMVLLQKEQDYKWSVALGLQGLGAARYDACIVRIAVHILVG